MTAFNPSFTGSRFFPLRNKRKPQTCCLRGHSYTKANTWINQNNGRRQCRTCMKQNYLRRRAGISSRL